MLIDAPPTLLNTIMHNKHLIHLMAKIMNELAHKSPLIEDGADFGQLPSSRHRARINNLVDKNR